jgi:ubiquinol-cytochrome c reductase iron-sulfur subunit
MTSLTSSSRTLLRTLPRTSLASLPIRALSTSSSRCQPRVLDTAFDSPFRGMGGNQDSKIPDFGHYKSKAGPRTNLVFQYFMVGTMGALTAAGAKATVQGTFGNF